MENIWFLFALSAGMFTAIANLLDIYFFEDDIYENAIEPVVTSGVTQLLPWLLIPILGFSIPNNGWVIFLAIFAGLLNILAYYFYFESIFFSKDASLAALFYNLLLAFIPLLAFFMVGEQLSLKEYGGIFLLFLGANVVVVSSVSKIDSQEMMVFVAKRMLCAVFLMALSVVLLKGVYEQANYWSSYLLFTLGMALGGFAIFFLFLRKRQKVRFIRTMKKSFWILFFAEGINVLAELFSNYAVSRGPASLVAAIESLQPAFVILFASGIVFLSRFFKRGTEHFLVALFRQQFAHFYVKFSAIILMAMGAYMTVS